jgi:uncharacterized membrane protein (Fun14 family)
MAKVERPEKYNWWLNELDSLGISTLEKNGLSNHKEASGQDTTSFAMSNFGIPLTGSMSAGFAVGFMKG